MNIFKSFFKSRDKSQNALVGTGWFHVGRSWSGKSGAVIYIILYKIEPK